MTEQAALRPAFGMLVGAAAGLLSGLLGIGGGLVVGPALALRGFTLPRALGTALWVVVPVAVMGVTTEIASASALLRPDTAAWLAAGGLFGAPWGARWVVRWPDGLLRAVFVLFLLFAAARSFGLVGGAAPSGALAGIGGGVPWLAALLSMGVGVLAGISSSLFGIGGGVVVVPGLVYLVGGFSFHAAAATSLLAMIPTAALGAWIARRQQRVDAASAAWLVPSAVVAAAAAVLLRNSSFDARSLAWTFGGFLLLVAARLAAAR